MKKTTASLVLGEMAEKVSAHLELCYGCWELSRLLLLSVFFSNFECPNTQLGSPITQLDSPNREPGLG
jgi:hypothetical protein